MSSKISHHSQQTAGKIAKVFTGYFGMAGQSLAMQVLFEQIEVVAKAHGPVMISAESATGKELVAHALHQQSDRADGPFVLVNCAGIPGMLQQAK